MAKWHWVSLTVLSVMATAATPFGVQANGSWGGSTGGSSGGYAAAYASSGGSSGVSFGGSSGGSWGAAPQGGFFARLAARHSGGSSGGSSGGVALDLGSSGGSVGASSGGQRVGFFRRLAAKIHARKAARFSGSHGGSSGGLVGASSGGSSGGFTGASSGGGVIYSTSGGASSGGASSGGASTGVYGYSAASTGSAPISSVAYESSSTQTSDQPYNVYSTGEAVADYGAAIDNRSSAGVPYLAGLGQSIVGHGSGVSAEHSVLRPSPQQDSVTLTIKVPSDAVVTVNDHQTQSRGPLRQFVSKGLTQGYVYTYVVKVTYNDNGQTVSDSKSFDLRSGEHREVEFDLRASGQAASPSDSDQNVVTVVRLNVPENATVDLAGNPTRGSGAVRTFRTKQLRAGQTWQDYTVKVTSDVDGQSVTKQRTVNVRAGSTTELTFEFGESVIAAL